MSRLATAAIHSIDMGHGHSDSDAQAVIITIDGPAGTGKSTVARLLAKRLGLEFLDTGSMYRAAALIAIEQGIDPERGEDLAQAVAAADMHFDWSADPPRLLLGDQDVSNRVRDMDVSRIVSAVAKQCELRSVLVAAQQSIASRHPRLVTEGRDQGSVVFPQAAVRFYLIADVNVRAGRRVSQLAASGKKVDKERIIEDIERRDRIDSSRDDAPLIKPDGAVEIDTSAHDVEEVVSKMEQIVREALPDAGFCRST